MVRVAVSLLCCAGLLGAVALVPAAPEEQNQKVNNTLRRQAALGQGRDAQQRGDYQAAVDILERELELSDGNRDYLNALRDAYLGLIRELRKKNASPDQVAVYQRRLQNLDPGALLELKTPAAPATPVTAAPATPVATAPVKEPEPALPAVVPVPVPAALAAQASAPTPPHGRMTARGQAEDIDPLSDANRLADPAAQKALAQAEEAFAARRYGEACRLYDQAARADASCVTAARERWAYCKLHGVVVTLNQAPASGPAVPPHELEREVRLALSMAPKLEDYGRKLLLKIQERQAGPGGAPDRGDEGGTAGVSHGEREGTWSVAKSANFRILHTQTPEFAERVARAAEAARGAAARKWLGEALPTWNTRCDIYLHVNRDDYSEATQQPKDCPGHSTLKGEGEKVQTRRIDLHCDEPDLVNRWLPHEMTHVVLADRFGIQSLPRWADEGMAVLSEPRERVELHLRNLPQHRRDRELFTVADLMQYKEYPEGRYISAFYAQSVSLVDYLTQQKGSLVFTQFLRDGLRDGFEPALRRHYELRGFADLQNHWLAVVFPGGSQSAYAERGR
jgi:tetratricopeptide (TPR) repeat protein